ncbi:insulin-like 7 precursor [Aplysia californica]|uniref:Insulin-like 7 n=1 Tax=Aplysia californica TaxID=6500 RepID=A1XP47_APLCA|nr:insulin-like 7 precursor [Aplysia californica]ABF18971.1 insulin-like 7 [Aplysia californica]
MTGNLDSGLAFTLLLVTSTMTFTHGETRYCRPGFSRPHPRGFCGSALARLHANFCLLLRWAYPEHFPMGKRSADRAAHHPPTTTSSPTIHGIPLSALADVSLTDHEQLRTMLYPDASGELKKPLLSEHEINEVWIQDNAPSSSPANPFVRRLRKRAARGKRSLVCDCCYSACDERKLAVY